jgi:quercetin dioxygenase-like cupin family protein
MRKLFRVVLVGLVSYSVLVIWPERPDAVHAAPISEVAINVNPVQMQWQKMEPALGASSPERAVLHEHPGTHITQFMVKMPPNFKVPFHWHSANETHTVISGKLLVEEDDKKIILEAGGFNYTPAFVLHRTSTSEEGALLFVTVDDVYDQHIGPPPKK